MFPDDVLEVLCRDHVTEVHIPQRAVVYTGPGFCAVDCCGPVDDTHLGPKCRRIVASGHCLTAYGLAEILGFVPDDHHTRCGNCEPTA